MAQRVMSHVHRSPLEPEACRRGTFPGLLVVFEDLKEQRTLMELGGWRGQWRGPFVCVGSVESGFDAGHRGPEPRCCFEESESDCNGPPCAPACLPLRFTTHLIRPAEKLNHTLSSHTQSMPRLSLLSLCLSFSPPPSLLYCVPVASRGFYYSCIHSLTQTESKSHKFTWVFSLNHKPSNDECRNEVTVLPLIVF